MSAAETRFCVVSIDMLGVMRVVGDHSTPQQAHMDVDLYWDTIAAEGEVVTMIPSTHLHLTGQLARLALC